MIKKKSQMINAHCVVDAIKHNELMRDAVLAGWGLYVTYKQEYPAENMPSWNLATSPPLFLVI